MSAERYEFGDVTVDLRRVEIRRAGVVISIEPKAFAVLRHLLEHRNRVVSKEELLDVVWTGTFVTPNVLTRAVAQIRKALGDNALTPRYIETISKQGYRLTANVVAFTESASVAQTVGVAPMTPPATNWRWWTSLATALVAITLTTALLWSGRRDRGAALAAATTAPTRLTTGRHSYNSPSLSSDGRHVAYASDRSGAFEIYISGLDPGSVERAVTADAGHNVQPAISPDGEWVAYHSRRHGGIWIVRANGGTPQQLATFGSMPYWSPNGEAIVFSSDAGGHTSHATLWTLRRSDSSLTELTSVGAPLGGHLSPTWSPNGKLIAFRVGQHARSEVWLVNASGGTPWRVAQNDRATPSRFSPDSTALYWTTRAREGNDRLMRTRLDQTGRLIDNSDVPVSALTASLTGLAVAANGTAVLAIANESTSNLLAIEIGEGLTASDPSQLTDDLALNSIPDYGLDGRIVYEQRIFGRPVTPWVMNEVGGDKTLLSPPLVWSVESPQWGPGGAQVFGLLSDEAKHNRFFAWIDVRTGTISRTATVPPPTAGPPDLSPDGQHVAYHLLDRNGVINVWTQKLDGRPARQLTFDREAISYPKWSADGKLLTVNIKRSDKTHVATVSVETGAVEQLTFEDGQSRPYSFAPDNSHIAFSAERNGVWNVYVVSRATKKITQLTHFSGEGGVMYPAWSPRGNRIIFERARSTSSLWTMQLR